MMESTTQIPKMVEVVKSGRHSLFEGMSESAIAQFEAAMEEVIYASGETMISQGDDGDDMFVLEAGTMRVTVTSGATKVLSAPSRRLTSVRWRSSRGSPEAPPSRRNQVPLSPDR